MHARLLVIYNVCKMVLFPLCTLSAWLPARTQGGGKANYDPLLQTLLSTCPAMTITENGTFLGSNGSKPQQVIHESYDTDRTSNNDTMR